MGTMRSASRSRPTRATGPVGRRQPPIRAGYEHFRLERQGALVSRKTLEYYDGMLLPFLTWLDGEGVERFEHLDVAHARQYRARLASTPGRHGRLLKPKTLLESHRAIGAFLRWATREGYRVDGRILDLTAPRVPDKEPTVGRRLSLLSRRERWLAERTAMLRRPLTRPWTIAFMSMKGGVGKTTTCASVGHVFGRERGDLVVALDFNPDGGGLSDAAGSESAVRWSQRRDT